MARIRRRGVRAHRTRQRALPCRSRAGRRARDTVRVPAASARGRSNPLGVCHCDLCCSRLSAAAFGGREDEPASTKRRRREVGIYAHRADDRDGDHRRPALDCIRALRGYARARGRGLRKQRAPRHRVRAVDIRADLRPREVRDDAAGARPADSHDRAAVPQPGFDRCRTGPAFRIRLSDDGRRAPGRAALVHRSPGRGWLRRHGGPGQNRRERQSLPGDERRSHDLRRREAIVHRQYAADGRARTRRRGQIARTSSLQAGTSNLRSAVKSRKHIHMSALARKLLVAFGVLGLAASSAATWVHYHLIVNPDYASFCDVNATISCKQAYLSRYGSVGGVPVAVGGVAFFVLVLLLVWGSRGKSRIGDSAPAYVFSLSTLALAVVLYLAYASFFILKEVCPLCVATYVAVA